MELEKIKLILDAIKDTDIEEIWIEKDGERSGFRRTDIKPAPPVPSNKNGAETQKVQTRGAVAPPSSLQNQIKSTMVGTFFRSPSPGGKPLVEEGDFVTIGQKVGIVEAMKVMKEMTSTVAGKIVKVSVKDGQPVEYGQPLFEVDTQITQMKDTDSADKKE